MAAEISPVRKRPKAKPLGFMALLSSAACEWFLAFLLFLDASLSYLLTKFAQYCELKAPCMLCSRLDKRKPGFYWSLLCTDHREEISSLASCSIHGKFADVHGMCEECLIPIATQNKLSSPDSYRLLVGKSWVEIDRSILQNLMLNKIIHRGPPSRKICSCCSKTWRAKSNAERLQELKSIGFGASKANIKPPLPRAPGRSRFSHRDSLKRLRDKFTGQGSQLSNNNNNSVDALSHVAYTKLKISSDSESEFPFSEDDDDGNKPQADSKEKIKPPSILDHQHNLLDLSDHKNNVDSLVSSDAIVGHGLGDLVWEESSNKQKRSSLLPELISLYDGPQSSNVSTETSTNDVFLPHMPAISVLSELLSLCNVPPLSSSATVPKKLDVGATTGKGDTSVPRDGEAPAAGTSSDNARPLASNNMHHQSNASTQTDDEVQQLSDKHTPCEPTMVCDSLQIKDDTKSTPELSLSSHDQSRVDEDFTSEDLPSPKKNDSNYETLDGNTLMDIEGESVVDRLKRQIENDRSLMNSLYKDLEEERNAAGIAANQAMAMITRLQEEKAALHMEALQYLRMMEEQAEYDMEALERANELLAEKEKELQDMENELEFYRNNFLDESGVHSIQKELTSVNSNSKGAKILKANGECKPLNGLATDFEEEKIYISQCLKDLEMKLHQAYLNGKFDGIIPNGLKSHENFSGAMLNQGNKKVISISNGDLAPIGRNENDCLHGNGDEINLATFEKEMAEIHDRLEALEADRNFLRHTSELLRNGKDGLQLVQEIASQLHELRKMEFRKR